MKADIGLSKSITSNKYYLVVNGYFYLSISKEMFYETAKFLNIKVEK